MKTVDDFIWEIINAYQEEVYCGGFPNNKSEKKFFEAARKIVKETFAAE